MKLLHLSDLHITGNDVANQPIKDRLSYIATHYPDHYYLISGDVIDNEGPVAPGAVVPLDPDNLEQTFQAVQSELSLLTADLQKIYEHTKSTLQKACALLKILPTGRVIMCAGNHDYGLWGNIYFDEFKKLFDDYLFTPLKPNLICGALLRTGQSYYPSPTNVTFAPDIWSATNFNCFNLPPSVKVYVLSTSAEVNTQSILSDGWLSPEALLSAGIECLKGDFRGMLNKCAAFAKGKAGLDSIKIIEDIFSPNNAIPPLGRMDNLFFQRLIFL